MYSRIPDMTRCVPDDEVGQIICESICFCKQVLEHGARHQRLVFVRTPCGFCDAQKHTLFCPRILADTHSHARMFDDNQDLDVAAMLQRNPHAFTAGESSVDGGTQTFVVHKRAVQDPGPCKIPASVTAPVMSQAAAPPQSFRAWKQECARTCDCVLEQMRAYAQEVQRRIELVQGVLATNAAMRRIVSGEHTRRFDAQLSDFVRWVLQAYTALMVASTQDASLYLDPSVPEHAQKRTQAHTHAMDLIRCCLVREARPVELQVLLCRVRSFDSELAAAPQLEVREWHNKHICDKRQRHAGLASMHERKQRDILLQQITRFEPVSTDARTQTRVTVFTDILGGILGAHISTNQTQPLLTASDFYAIQFRFLPAHAQLRSKTDEDQDASAEDGLQMIETESSMSVPLQCPLSCMPMRTPVRFRSCGHLQCFDLHSFRDMCLQAKRARPSAEEPIKCPICDKPSDSLDQLGVDRWMLNILTKIRARYDLGDDADDALDFTDSDEEQESPRTASTASNKRAWTDQMRVVHQGRAWSVVTDSQESLKRADVPVEELL